MQSFQTRLPLLLAMVAGAAMLATTAYQGYRFWQEDRQPETATAAVTVQQVDTPETRAPQVNLAVLELFGSLAAEQTSQPQNTEDLPETNLRLYLRGVLAADGDFPGSALIEDDKRKTEAYLVGDELPGGATLRTVFPNRVVIERSGKLENLYFPETEERADIALATPPPPSAEAAATPPPRPQATPSQAVSPDAEQARREEIRRRLEQLRERLRNSN